MQDLARNGDREGMAAFVMRMRAIGIDDKRLFSAMEMTPRRAFVPADYQSAVWSARTVPIACGETLEGIDLQGRVLAALEPADGQRVLEIGTGSGYATAVLARLSGRVTSVERFKTLVADAQERLRTLGIANVVLKHGDAERAVEGEGPYDRIVVWAAFDALPRNFTDLLSSGGVMICAIGPSEDEQQLVKLTKVGSRFEREDLGRVRFQPLVRGVAARL